MDRARREYLVVATTLLALVSPSCDDGPSEGSRDDPSITISDPAEMSLLRSGTFEVTGSLAGAVTTIELGIDGAFVANARRVDEPDGWRVPASNVSLTPGYHELTAVASGEHGTASTDARVLVEPDASAGFGVRINPEAATYELPLVHDVDEPRVLLFGPPDEDDILLELQIVAPAGISTRLASMLFTASTDGLTIDVDDEVAGVFPIVVRATSAGGEVHDATFTLTLVDPSPTTTAPANTVAETVPGSTEAPRAGVAAVLTDDFEGDDRWTAAVSGTNGATATAQLAAGGNPGGLRRMTHVLPGAPSEDESTTVGVVHLYVAGGYDPATEGAIASVDYREDQIQYDPPFEGAAVGTSFVIEQGGVRFTAPIVDGSAFSAVEWQTLRAVGLTPADFSPAPGPDFTEAGGPMTFGYVRSNTNRSATGITTQHGIDNWTVELIAAV